VREPVAPPPRERRGARRLVGWQEGEHVAEHGVLEPAQPVAAAAAGEDGAGSGAQGVARPTTAV